MMAAYWFWQVIIHVMKAYICCVKVVLRRQFKCSSSDKIEGLGKGLSAVCRVSFRGGGGRTLG